MSAPSHAQPTGESAEAMFRASFDDAPVGMAVVDPMGTWVRVNRALADLLGYAPEDLEGHSFQEFTHPDDRPLRTWFDDAVAAGQSPRAPLEKRYLTADGRIIWVAVTSSVVAEGGRPQFVISHIRDITDRKRREGLEEQRRRRADVLVRLADVLARQFTSDVDELLDTVAAELVATIGAFSTVLLASDDDPELLELRAVRHHDPLGEAFIRDTIAAQPMRSGEGIAGRVFADGEPYVVRDGAADRVAALARPDFAPMVDHFGAESVVIVPLRVHGRTIGVLSLGRPRALGEFVEEDVEFLGTIAERVALAVDNARLYQALRASEERVRLLHRNAPLGMAAITADGRFAEVNPALCALLGRAEEELVGSYVTVVVPPRDHRESVRQWRSLVDGETEADQYEQRYVRPDGTLVWARVHATVVHDEDGHFDHLLAQTIDITERRRAEGVLAAFFDSVPDLLCTVDFTGRLVAVNPAWTRVLGWSADELLGRAFADFVHPDDVERSTDPAILDAAAAGRTVRYENRYRTKAGDYRWLQWHAVVLHDGGIAVASARDITDERRHAEELRQSNADLSQFASVAAHDLKSPLAVVAGFADLLSTNQSVADDEDAVESVGHIRDGAHRLLQLVDDLLDYSRIGAGPVLRREVDLDVLVRQVLDDLAVDLRRRDAVVSVGPLPEVRGDAGQLRQLFQNLISNAAKFVPDDRRPEVVVRAAADNGGWTVSVADNGIGIPSDRRGDVFGMFQRLPDAAGYEGTGIGLAICRRVVERHGGTIWFDENEPAGSVVRFTLDDDPAS